MNILKFVVAIVLLLNFSGFENSNKLDSTKKLTTRDVKGSIESRSQNIKKGRN